MPRPLHHGRTNAVVIPGEWQQQIEPVITNVLVASGCVIRITPPGGAPSWNDATKQTETAPLPDVYGPGIGPHDGAASITVVSDTDRDITIADQDLATRLYEIRLPWDAPAEADTRGLLVTVVTDPDPDLDGRFLTVQSAERDTRRFSRLLYATLTD